MPSTLNCVGSSSILQRAEIFLGQLPIDHSFCHFPHLSLVGCWQHPTSSNFLARPHCKEKLLLGRQLTYQQQRKNLQNEKAGLNLHTPGTHQPLAPPCKIPLEDQLLWTVLWSAYVQLQLKAPLLHPRQLYILLKSHQPHRPLEPLRCSPQPVSFKQEMISDCGQRMERESLPLHQMYLKKSSQKSMRRQGKFCNACEPILQPIVEG